MEKKIKMGCGSKYCMKYVALFALALLLCGCITQQEDIHYEVPAEESAPTQEAEHFPIVEEEEIIVEEPAQTGTPQEEEPAPENEEELLRWDVGVTEELDEGHRKLQAVEFDGYVLIVDDITDDKPYPCAALRVGEMGGAYITTLFQDKVCPGNSVYWTSPEGDVYRIKVFETAAGYLGYAYWADVAVYKQG